MYWDSTMKINDSFGGYKFIGDTKGSDKHICSNCIKTVFEFVKANKDLVYGKG